MGRMDGYEREAGRRRVLIKVRLKGMMDRLVRAGVRRIDRHLLGSWGEMA